jgi:signal transduction histidine kinase
VTPPPAGPSSPIVLESLLELTAQPWLEQSPLPHALMHLAQYAQNLFADAVVCLWRRVQGVWRCEISSYELLRMPAESEPALLVAAYLEAITETRTFVQPVTHPLQSHWQGYCGRHPGRLMEVPLWLNGQVAGVLVAGGAHVPNAGETGWTRTEELVVAHLAQTMSRLMASSDRALLMGELARSNHLLEERVRQRTQAMAQAQAELLANYEQLSQANQQLAQAHAQLLQSEKLAAIGQLAAGVAHEINNPVGFVSSNFRSLERYMRQLLALVQAYDDMQSPAQAASAELQALKARADLAFLGEDLPALLQESQEGLERVKKIVRDLKDFSRIDHTEWLEADINQGIESTLNVLRHETRYKASIQRQLGELPPVRCMPGQINQVVMNLVLNALQAIGPAGLITLASQPAAIQGRPGIRVEVSDNGCGMGSETLRRIFEPFFTTKPVGTGTGLGLSLSYSIIRKHEGVLDVSSEIGKGSTFWFWLPQAGPSRLEETDFTEKL